MKYTEGVERLSEALEGNGAFLVVADGKGGCNVMTIGWAQVGVIWGKPVMTVLVRPSRYSHEFLEKAGTFSVCVPAASGMERELSFCGSRSGRDIDKVQKCGFNMKAGSRKGISYIAGSELVYECAVLGKSVVQADTLERGVKARYYPTGDYHAIYFGEILAVHKG